MNREKTSIFVAGAGGAIGRRLCPLLLADGWQVIGTTRSEEKAGVLRRIGVEPVIIDVFNADDLLKVVVSARPAVIIHQLTDLPFGLDPNKMAEARIRTARIRDEGTRNLIAAAIASGAQRLIAQSIAFAYAPGPMPYPEEAPLNINGPDEGAALTARGIASLEQQVLSAPLVGIILRYGHLYGPGTGLDSARFPASVHVDAAADAARRAVTRGVRGVYNIAKEDGVVLVEKAATELDWQAEFRIDR